MCVSVFLTAYEFACKLESRLVRVGVVDVSESESESATERRETRNELREVFTPHTPPPLNKTPNALAFTSEGSG